MYQCWFIDWNKYDMLVVDNNNKVNCVHVRAENVWGVIISFVQFFCDYKLLKK